MSKPVSVTLAVVDRMVELVQELDRACTLPPLPPMKERDRKRWRRALEEAKEERAAAFRQAQAGALVPRSGMRARSGIRVCAREAGEQILENAETKYRRTAPTLWAETKERRRKAKALSEELAELFLWHGPDLDRRSRLGNRRAEWYADAAAPGIRSGLRAGIVEDLARIRLKLEDDANVAAQNREVLLPLMGQVGRSGSLPASGEGPGGKAQGGDGVDRPPAGEEQDDKLPPSRVKARATYEYALNTITGAGEMTVAELFDAVRDRLDAEICKAAGKQAEQLQELKDSLPDNAETFGRYLREAGVKKYDKTGQHRLPSRSIRRKSEI